MVRVKVRVRVNVNPNPNPLCWLRPMGYSLDEGILRPGTPAKLITRNTFVIYAQCEK